MVGSPVFQGIGFGLSTASMLAIASVGLTLQFGVTNFVYFAYGEFMTLGDYLAYAFGANLRIVIYPVTSFRLAMGVVERGLAELLRDGTQSGIVQRMQTRKRLYELVDYAANQSLDQDLYEIGGINEDGARPHSSTGDSRRSR